MNYSTFDETFEQLRYPAGESHLRLREDVDLTRIEVIEATVRSFEGLGNVVTADRLLRRLGRAATWFIPYFPFARHDRRTDRLDGFELEFALDLARELDVVIADPHSDVAGMLPHLPQSAVVDVLRAQGIFANDPIVVIPDAGATKKALTWVGDATVVQARKQRDVATGKLCGFGIDAAHLGGRFGRRPCIIVDDICDAGGTFLGLADELEAAGAGPLTLAVTHGLFTKGLSALSERFSRIVTFTPSLAQPRKPAPPQLGAMQTIEFRTLYEKGTVQ